MKTMIGIFALLIAVPLFASETYRFHVSITSVYEALGVINPDFQKTAPPETRTEKVLLFSHGEGGHWKAMIGPCAHVTDGQSEVLIDSNGGGCRKDATATRNYDAAFRVNGDRDLTLTCLRAECAVHFVKGNQKGDLAITRGTSVQVPLDSDIILTVNN